MSEQDKAFVFAAWLSGEMNEQQRSQFERYCIDDKAFADRVAHANQIGAVVEESKPLGPPKWDKSITFEQPSVFSWWQWSGLSAVSFVFSVFALVLAFSGVNLKVEEGRLSVGFQSQVTEQQIAKVVENKIDEYQASNLAMFAQYAEAINAQQQQSSAQLTEYLLSSSRKERREDFAELIAFINQQRTDDQVFFARKLNNLQQEIVAQNELIIAPLVNE